MSTIDTHQVTPSKIRLARALVDDAARRREHESARIEELAQLPLPEDRQAS